MFPFSSFKYTMILLSIWKLLIVFDNFLTKKGGSDSTLIGIALCDSSAQRCTDSTHAAYILLPSSPLINLPLVGDLAIDLFQLPTSFLTSAFTSLTLHSRTQTQFFAAYLGISFSGTIFKVIQVIWAAEYLYKTRLAGHNCWFTSLLQNSSLVLFSFSYLFISPF